ncbi:hypothetical protein FHS29_000981 [Saccharothrix tamanrassetensis]|uniref:Uncharacterized protein n=1 Tax=Saccharothrix tamanrassetensis TaxID=1051531 RepID=A0A841CB26_9PSEU|nr:hypothetical protein [Saccharothrix tamanrassetensis]MBB5954411.1 hypothetical protein [Saccharothrix tamanrassetensis]
MTPQDDFLGGLHYDGARDVQVGPQTGIVRYYPVEPSGPPPRRRTSPWWHLLGVLLGALGIGVAAFAWGYGIDQFDEVRVRGLVAMGLAGLVVGLVTLGRLSPAAPLTAGGLSLAGAVAYELSAFRVLPVLRMVFESGVPVGVGVLLIVLAFRRR